MLDWSKLPLEVLGVVVEGARDDLATLRALSLVSQFFLIPCQRHIFKEILVNPASRLEEDVSGTTMCYNLLTFLRHNHRLCHYIREVHFVQEYFSRLEGSWLLGSVVADILTALSSSPIRRLSIVFPSAMYTPRRRWEDLSPGFRHSLYQILLNPHFRHLTLSNIELVPSYLPSHFPNITHLTLTTVTFAATPGNAISTTSLSNQDQTLSRLQHLGLGYAPHAHSDIQITNPLFDIDTSQIRSLTLSLPDTPRPRLDIQPFLQLEYLRVLHIHFTYSPRWSYLNSIGYKLDFASLVSLEELTFSGRPSERQDKRYRIFWDREVTWWLSTSSLTSLRHLNVIFELGAMNAGTFLDDLQDTLSQLSDGLASAHKRYQGVLEDVKIRFKTEDQMVVSLRQKATSLISWRGCESVLKVDFPYGFVPLLPYQLF
ncbi:hypothetical protein BDN72DRAFT_461078 [Pluteus cervinus]|uniref:Uncharacterized protein n=1 Tax=Pluteus cervinus TaxID=181527 RepID=A0ACD3A6Q2_9AGAR|nr:hypothetical protein BDN72DRAFT_461078 [Pluteus cervinus]